MTKQEFILKAQPRKEIGKQVDKLRQTDKLPAVLYGHKVKNQNLALNIHEFEKIFEQAGESTLIDLTVAEASPVKVLIHDIQRHPVSHKIIHTDLYQVRMDEKIKTDVELVFINESPAVKDLSGVLVKTLDKIEIECLPGDLISHVDIDLSVLETFEDVIRIKDLVVPEKVHILNDLESAIALVEEPRKIEEEAPIGEGEEGEGGEEGAEGEESKEGEEGGEKKEGEEGGEKAEGGDKPEETSK